MSTQRLRRRVPSARVVDTAVLPGHRLAWHKKGSDGSGKCDIPVAGGDEAVYGVVYAIDPVHKPRLDRAEGLGFSYGQKHVDVRLLGREESVGAVTYYALRTDPSRVPYAWYLDHVLIGAREHALPGHYVRRIECVPATADPDPHRERAERSVHAPGPAALQRR